MGIYGPDLVVDRLGRRVPVVLVEHLGRSRCRCGVTFEASRLRNDSVSSSGDFTTDTLARRLLFNNGC
ncbi:MAG: hypothetical protein U5R31_13820 [Acidimicrobiia bacterium]|nr:hypothetical protein [Acidimicrobiia bacterium]